MKHYSKKKDIFLWKLKGIVLKDLTKLSLKWLLLKGGVGEITLRDWEGNQNVGEVFDHIGL